MWGTIWPLELLTCRGRLRAELRKFELRKFYPIFTDDKYNINTLHNKLFENIPSKCCFYTEIDFLKIHNLNFLDKRIFVMNLFLSHIPIGTQWKTVLEFVLLWFSTECCFITFILWLDNVNHSIRICKS